MTTDFSGFGLPDKLMQSLVRMQFTKPTPIQEAAIPLAMQGRDILGSAQTGTGKTGAFGIPLIAKLIENPQAAALVMTPTRELAAQVIATLHQMIPVQTIRTALLIGGEPMPKQFRQLQAHPRLIVGTPGRINDHLQRGLRLNNVRFLVLDETDRMLDMGFGIQIEKIVAQMPSERQTMMFSATMPAGIVKLSSKYLNKPERVSVGSTITASPNIKQELLQVTESEKYPRLLEQLKDNANSVIIFVKTKYGTEKLAEKLAKNDYKTDAIHGDLRQSRRDRVISNFRDRKFQILVATDLAARGLDVPHIDLVINYDLPQCPEDYIHRIGRTARAGASGKAVNLLTPADRGKWREIHKLMNPGQKDTTVFRREERGDREDRGDRKEGFGRNKPRNGGKWQGKKKSWHPLEERMQGAEARDNQPREFAPRDGQFSHKKPRDEKPWHGKPREDKPWGGKPRGEGKPGSFKPKHADHKKTGFNKSKPYHPKPSRSDEAA